MAITPTKKVTSTWIDGNPPRTGVIVAPFITDMVAQEKTDGIFYLVSDTESYRLWTDLTSAQAFADLMVSSAARVSRTDYSYIITDV